MTRIVGVDFGTTNVRIAQWDIDSGANPASCEIGIETAFTMPAVIAFQRQRSGEVDLKFGEEADALEDARDVKVVRNIKRYALTSDNYVLGLYEWDLQRQRKSWPTWFDLDSRSIRFWNKSMAVEEAIRLILKESISRAGLAGTAAEWRAACPVSSDLMYRRELVSALSELGCTGKIKWISEEPLLLLALGRAIGSLENGYFVVYDLGGGSFDCAVVEIKDDQLIVLADEGLPALGGMDIDDMLSAELDYDGDPRLLRIAKEQLSSDANPIDLPGGHTLTNDVIGKVLERGAFIDKTLTTMVNAYNKARMLTEDAVGDMTFGRGWQASIEAMRRDVDKVLVVGGPTRMPYFTEKLTDIFGVDKVVTADELTQSTGRVDIADAALTALSHGACYMYGNTFIPLTVDRVPASIALEVTDGHSTEEDTYVPFHRLPFRQPLAPFEGKTIVRRQLYDKETTRLSAESESAYTIRVKSPDGDTLYDSGPLAMRMPGTGHRGPHVDRIRLVVDRLGGVRVRLSAGFTDITGSREEIADVVLDPPWQPQLQSMASLKPYYERGRARLDKDPAAKRDLPYGGSLHAAYGDRLRRG